MEKYSIFLAVLFILFGCKKANESLAEAQIYNEAALPTANFRVANTMNSDGISVMAGRSLCIENNSENAITYFWEFDDKTSTDKFPAQVILNNCGANRSIKLTTKNADGKIATVIKYYNVICSGSGG